MVNWIISPSLEATLTETSSALYDCTADAVPFSMPESSAALVRPVLSARSEMVRVAESIGCQLRVLVDATEPEAEVAGEMRDVDRVAWA